MNVLKGVSIHSLAVVTALNFMPVNAFAQSQPLDDCSCLVPASASGQPVGSIVAIDGRVQVSGATGFSDSKVGTMLSGGNRIIVGPRSSASLSLGDKCPLQVSANQDVALDPVDAKICVRVLDQTTTAEVQLRTLSSTSSQVYTPFLLDQVKQMGVDSIKLKPDLASTVVPIPRPQQKVGVDIGTEASIYAAPNDVIVDGSDDSSDEEADAGPSDDRGIIPNEDPALANGAGGGANAIAVAVLSLAGVAAIVAVATSGGDKPVSN